jgi:dihydropyrimidine dehydrogenase (NAD+) subunit PreA
LAVCEKALAAGAKWVVTNHMTLTVAPPDIWNGGKGRFPGLDYNPFGALMGSALRMQSYKTTSMVSKTFPELDTWAGGGIDRPEHLVEQILFGAKAGQCLNGIVTNGIKFITQVNDFLEYYMEKCGYKTIEDFRGLGLKYFKPTSECTFLDYVAQTDYDLCTGCGACAETYCPCTTMVDGRPHVDIELCSGCGMCAVPCNADAIRFVPREEAMKNRE